MTAGKWVKFELKREPGSNVAIAGTFNDWKPKKVRYCNRNGYVIRLPLAPGSHEYKFVVDGEWLTDPNNPDTTPNDKGTLNSVIKVS